MCTIRVKVYRDLDKASKIFGKTRAISILADSAKHLKSINIHIVILARVLGCKRTHLLAFCGSQTDTETKN